MGDGSGIEWTDATWNPTVGCTKVSPGCDNCYAETFVNRFTGSKGFPLPFDELLLRGERFLHLPLTWREPRRIFVNSLSDLFHADVPDSFIARVFAVMAAAPQHSFQLLTKRHARLRSLLTSPRWPELLTAAPEWPPAFRDGKPLGLDLDPERPLPNVWLGVSVEDQQWANIRIPALLDTPAAVRWISAEPLLGPVDLTYAIGQHTLGLLLDDCLRCCVPASVHGEQSHEFVRPLDWIVAGGESGGGARPMDPAWVRALRDECAATDVPFLMKQWGSHDADGNRVSKRLAGRVLDGVTHDGYPV